MLPETFQCDSKFFALLHISKTFAGELIQQLHNNNFDIQYACSPRRSLLSNSSSSSSNNNNNNNNANNISTPTTATTTVTNTASITSDSITASSNITSAVFFDCEVEECSYHILLYSKNLANALVTIGLHGNNKLNRRSFATPYGIYNNTPIKITTVPCPYSFYYYYIHNQPHAFTSGDIFDKLNKAVTYNSRNVHPHGRKIQIWTVKNVKRFARVLKIPEIMDPDMKEKIEKLLLGPHRDSFMDYVDFLLSKASTPHPPTTPPLTLNAIEKQQD